MLIFILIFVNFAHFYACTSRFIPFAASLLFIAGIHLTQYRTVRTLYHEQHKISFTVQFTYTFFYLFFSFAHFFSCLLIIVIVVVCLYEFDNRTISVSSAKFFLVCLVYTWHSRKRYDSDTAKVSSSWYMYKQYGSILQHGIPVQWLSFCAGGTSFFHHHSSFRVGHYLAFSTIIIWWHYLHHRHNIHIFVCGHAWERAFFLLTVN